MTRAWYNEIDPFAAAWLRSLIEAGAIAPGDVDERDIREVQPHELRDYTQVHLFAGIGGWPLALRLAGWPDDRPVWTGSCPCQPFSSAGRGRAERDPRHLWPEMLRLVRECRPPAVFGEQVASRLGRDWLAGVRADLEGVGYAVGAADLCAAGLGAPHIRQRLYWVADAPGTRHLGAVEDAEGTPRNETRMLLPGPFCRTDRLDDAIEPGLQGHAGDGNDGREPRRLDADAARHAAETGCLDRLGYTTSGGRGLGRDAARAGRGGYPERPDGTGLGAWADYALVLCRDGKTRRVPPPESGVHPLAHGVSARVGRLRGYGNAIVPQVAAAFIAATGLLSPETGAVLVPSGFSASEAEPPQAVMPPEDTSETALFSRGGQSDTESDETRTPSPGKGGIR